MAAKLYIRVKSNDYCTKWTSFATIKTSGYEQWIGGAAKGYCEQPAIIWDLTDYSSALMRKVKQRCVPGDT